MVADRTIGNDIFILQKLAKKHEWTEVIKLYSGLFNSENERNNFVLNLAETNILLAAECKNTSIKQETYVSESIIELAEKKLNLNIYHNLKSLKAIANLNKIDLVIKYLLKMNANKAFKNTIMDLFSSCELEIQLHITIGLSKIRNINPNKIAVCIKSLNKDIPSSLQEELISLIFYFLKKRGLPKKYAYLKKFLNETKFDYNRILELNEILINTRNYEILKIVANNINKLDKNDQTELLNNLNETMRTYYPKIPFTQFMKTIPKLINNSCKL